ncbi:MAG: acyl CoA:acetate/3-ketoacid CoA transferase [Candidatus Methanomethylicia archaeon]
MKSKIITAKEAVEKIEDEKTLATSGFTGQCFPQELVRALRERFLQTGKPKNLTIIFAAGQGGGRSDIGLDLIACEGLIRRIIFSHCGLLPGISKLIMENKILAYNMPQGVISQLFREIAAKRPGLITHVGLYTYIDPRIEGGKVNEITKKCPENLIELIEIGGKEYLFYKSIPIDVAFIRGTTADEKGNISMEEEGNTLENLSIAQATKNSGGIVIAQVKRLAKYGTLPARTIEIPGILVDYIVLAKPENHWQTFVEPYNPAISGQIRIPTEILPEKPLDERKIIGRRALMELKPGYIVNLGIGTPEEVASVAAEEGIFEDFTLTVESGTVGGIPLSGLYFGVAINFEALLDQPYQFDFYDGGGLDIAFLGMAEVDEKGNVNVSKFGGRFVGCGGFINISQNAKKVVFVGTFTARDLKINVEDGEIRILQEGKIKKFVKQVEHITFSGEYARKLNKEVLYVTERAVFRLGKDSIILEEIAPGIDIEKDILNHMEFKPRISDKLKVMDEKIFKKDKMNIKSLWLHQRKH